ncbi:Frataxin, mitochondrial, partial [Fragariocoptes setiger]
MINSKISRSTCDNNCYQKQYRFLSSGHNNKRSDGKQPGAISSNHFHSLANETLEKLSDTFDEILELQPGADVSLSDGVLTVIVKSDAIYVINKQSPNQQLWFSSPLSGPKRFDMCGNQWIDRDTKQTMKALLSRELSTLLNKPVSFP